MKWVLLASAWLLLWAAPFSAQQIPAGTALPVMLDSTLDARKAKPGRKISARIMQAIQLPDGTKVPAGSHIVGHILRVSGPTVTSPSQLVFKFDHLNSRGRSLPLITSLRALASMTEVFEAQLPTSNFDEYGTSTADWTTIQVGGDAVYRGSGEVISPDNKVVGSTTVGGDVNAKLAAVPDRGCRGPIESNDRKQALWVLHHGVRCLWIFRLEGHPRRPDQSTRGNRTGVSHQRAGTRRQRVTAAGCRSGFPASYRAMSCRRNKAPCRAGGPTAAIRILPPLSVCR